MTAIGSEILKLGWRAGSVLSRQTAQKLMPFIARSEGFDIQDVDWLIIASQTCDVVAAKLSQEPYVEVLHCRPIQKLRPQFRDMASTRRLDFRPNRELHDELLTVHATEDRYYVKRDFLLTESPDAERVLSNIAVTRLLKWTALRYSRPSWPNNFVSRVSSAKESLLEALNLIHDDVAEVRVAIAESDRELAAGDDYHVVVFFIIDEKIWNEDTASRERVYSAFANFVAALARCEGIEVDSKLSEVVPGNHFSWQEVNSTDEWNFANLTYQE